MITTEQIIEIIDGWKIWNERRIEWYETDKKLKYYYSARAKQCVDILEEIKRTESGE